MTDDRVPPIRITKQQVTTSPQNVVAILNRAAQTGIPAAELEHSGELLAGVHPDTACAGRPCPIHNRSDHPMRGWPQHWRTDRRIIERTCPHSCSHPDPDMPWPPGSPEWVHGCDGCCTKETPSPANPPAF